MLHRLTYIENRKTLADAGEYVTDIRVPDPITGMFVEVRATNGGTSNRSNLVADVIDSIEIIDGSEVLLSLDGREALAITAYKFGYLPYQLICETDGLTQNWYFPVRFGRWWGDEQYAFDPTKFSNPQVRIKWNLANVRAVGATGFLSGSAQFTVLADVMEGAAAPVGMLTLKEHYSFTTAASGVTYVDLPTDHKLKAFYVKCHEDGLGQSANISYFKLNCNQGQYVPFDLRRTDYLRWLTLNYPPFHYKHLLKAANGDTAYFIPKLDEQVAYTPATADTVVAGANNGIGEQTLSVYVGGSASASSRNIWALVHGWLPFGVSYFPFGDEDTPSEWLDTSIFKSVRLELTNANAGAEAAVVLEQERLY